MIGEHIVKEKMFKNRRMGLIYPLLLTCVLLSFACLYLDDFSPATATRQDLHDELKKINVIGFDNLTEPRITQRPVFKNRDYLCDTRPAKKLEPKFFSSKKLRKQPWPNDPECRKFETKRARKGNLPVVALPSFPGSGNTWVRYLIEAVTGIYTGSIYEDYHLYFEGFGGELADWKSGQTVVQKTHDFSPEHIRNFSSHDIKTAILIARNPYDAIISYHNYLYGGHNGFAPREDYKRPEWKIFLYLQLKNWLGTLINWITFSDRILVLHYETLRENPTPVFKDIGKFLGLPIEEGRLNCIKKHPLGKFKRPTTTKKAPAEGEADPFPEEVRIIIDRSIRYANFLLKKNCLAPTPFPLYSYYNGTGHVKKAPSMTKINAALEEEKSIWIKALFDWMPQVGTVIGVDCLDGNVRSKALGNGFDVEISDEFSEHKQVVQDFENLNRTIFAKLPEDFFSPKEKSMKVRLGKGLF